MMVKKLIDKLQENFFSLLDIKTNWGRNEVKSAFRTAVVNTLFQLVQEEEGTKSTPTED